MLPATPELLFRQRTEQTRHLTVPSSRHLRLPRFTMDTMDRMNATTARPVRGPPMLFRSAARGLLIPHMAGFQPGSLQAVPSTSCDRLKRPAIPATSPRCALNSRMLPEADRGVMPHAIPASGSCLSLADQAAYVRQRFHATARHQIRQKASKAGSRSHLPISSPDRMQPGVSDSRPIDR